MTSASAEMRQGIASAWSTHPHPLVAADLLTATVVVDPYDRQSILEQVDPIRRLQLVRVQLGNAAWQLSTDSIPEELLEEE